MCVRNNAAEFLEVCTLQQGLGLSWNLLLSLSQRTFLTLTNKLFSFTAKVQTELCFMNFKIVLDVVRSLRRGGRAGPWLPYLTAV